MFPLHYLAFVSLPPTKHKLVLQATSKDGIENLN